MPKGIYKRTEENFNQKTDNYKGKGKNKEKK